MVPATAASSTFDRVVVVASGARVTEQIFSGSVPFSMTSASESVSPAPVPNAVTPFHCGSIAGFGGAAVKPPLPSARTASWLAYSSAVVPVEYLKPPPLNCWLIR